MWCLYFIEYRTSLCLYRTYPYLYGSSLHLYGLSPQSVWFVFITFCGGNPYNYFKTNISTISLVWTYACSYHSTSIPRVYFIIIWLFLGCFVKFWWMVFSNSSMNYPIWYRIKHSILSFRIWPPLYFNKEYKQVLGG